MFVCLTAFIGMVHHHENTSICFCHPPPPTQPHPLKPHFYTVKQGFTGVYIFFLISTQKQDYGYSLEQPHLGGSNEYL